MGISHRTHYSLPEYGTEEISLRVPLDRGGVYAKRFRLTDAEKAALPAEISVFAREFRAPGGENLPRLVYFQGGPGSAAPRPEILGGWLKPLLRRYRVVMLDERGTGLSSPIDGNVLNGFPSPRVQAAYLACFRADSITDDAEELRRELQADEPWAALGQSFGGFCITAYLSRAPHGLAQAFITGGLPSLTDPADEVYIRTWADCEKRNREFFARYPKDEDTCWDIVSHLADTPETLPTGERLSPRRFRMIGINLGWSYGFETLHYMLENPFVWINGRKRLSGRFLNSVGNALSFAGNPLYWALHESIYAQDFTGATRWAAHRIRRTLPQFALPDPAHAGEGEERLRRELREKGYGFRFSAEHVFPWQGEEDPALRAMAEAAGILAGFTDFPALYDVDTLGKNTVPTAAFIYENDLFVPAELSLRTAGKISALKPIYSRSYFHDALRTDSAAVIGRLLQAAEED